MDSQLFFNAINHTMWYMLQIMPGFKGIESLP